MKIKKLLPFLVIIALTSCEEIPPEDENPIDEEEPTEEGEFTYKDGTYVATFDDWDYNQGKAILKFTLTDDEVKDVDFDYLDKKGIMLSLGGEIPCISIDPNTFLPNVENAIANSTIVPEFNEIDVLAQAEKETEDANVLANAIFDAAKDGNTDTIIVTQEYYLEYVDGTYHGEFDNYSHGWKPFLKFDIINDEIINVDYDELDSLGNRKSEDQEYNDRMYEYAGQITKPEWYVVEIESNITNASVICSSTVVEIDAVTGATGSSEYARVLLDSLMDYAVIGVDGNFIISSDELF